MGKKCAFLLALMLGEVSALATSMAPMVIGGRNTVAGEFPEAVFISNGRARCSASFIGPKALLTAAHCTKNNGEVVPVSEVSEAYTLEVAGAKFKATCTISDKYASEQHDMALCVVSKAVNLKWATIVAKGDSPKVDDQITHIGFGCTEEGGGGDVGTLKIGTAVVIETSSPAEKNYWFHTQGDGLCFGDSGGPAFKFMEDPKKDSHIAVGVNSKGNIKDLNALTDLATEQSYAFMKKWAAAKKVDICGVTKDCYPSPKEEEMVMLPLEN